MIENLFRGPLLTREKKHDMPIMVNPDNFMSGDWEVVAAPSTAQAGNPVKIIVRRKL